ncbi:hypothetical protein NMY22_g20266 [Coprinellus aureogranulatus]|nr:hypothetical protein NMY22_g20266 [Coprinellus aureogranulatus]
MRGKKRRSAQAPNDTIGLSPSFVHSGVRDTPTTLQHVSNVAEFRDLYHTTVSYDPPIASRLEGAADHSVSEDGEGEEQTAQTIFPMEKQHPFTFKLMLHKLYGREDWLKKVQEARQSNGMTSFVPLKFSKGTSSLYPKALLGTEGLYPQNIPAIPLPVRLQARQPAWSCFCEGEPRFLISRTRVLSNRFSPSSLSVAAASRYPRGVKRGAGERKGHRSNDIAEAWPKDGLKKASSAWRLEKHRHQRGATVPVRVRIACITGQAKKCVLSVSPVHRVVEGWSFMDGTYLNATVGESCASGSASPAATTNGRKKRRKMEHSTGPTPEREDEKNQGRSGLLSITV